MASFAVAAEKLLKNRTPAKEGLVVRGDLSWKMPQDGWGPAPDPNRIATPALPELLTGLLTGLFSLVADPLQKLDREDCPKVA